MASRLAGDGSTPSRTGRRLASALNPLTAASASAPQQCGRTADPADLRQLREPYLKQHDQATRHVRSMGQNSTTEATDRAVTQHASPSSPQPLSSPLETPHPDPTQTTPGSGWTIAGLWRKARSINLEAEADNNPIGFMGIVIALAGLIVAVLTLAWTVVQGVASLVLEARSSSSGEAMQQAKRRIEESWTNVRRRADKVAHHVGLSLPTLSFDRMHARHWDRPMQEKKDS